MTREDWLLFPRTAVAAAVAVVAAATTLPALAQNTTSAVSGRVVGADGQPVAGATVTITHQPSGTTVTATTDTQGRYAARGLRAGGPYTITFQRGSDVDRRADINLALAETLQLDGQLGAAAQTVTVTGRLANERFNRGNMGAGTNIGQRELNAFASIQRNLQDYARTDPRLSQTDKERGEISAAGQNTRFNSITIDGLTTNDTFGLEANNLPTLKQPISIDAIQSVQVNLSNYDVTQKGYTGANINAVTKSGTNELSGSVYYVFRDESMVGRRYNRATQGTFTAPPFQESTRGFTLGGPILKDRLFFFASYEEFSSSRASPNFGPLGSPRINVGISQATIDSAIEIARTTWGFDAGTSVVPGGLEVLVKDTLLKLDWNISDSHRASVRYTSTKQDEPILPGFSATGLSLSSWWYNQAKTVDTVVAQWFADWTPTFSTELKFSQRDYDSEPTPINGARLPAIGLRFSGALPPGTPGSVSANNRFLNMGTELSRHFNVLRTDTTDVYAGATWTLGDHELKFGVDYADNEIFNAFLQNVNGNYTFGCEPGSYSFGTVASCNGNYTPTGGGAAVPMTSALRDLATLENFRRGLPSAYTLQAPQSGRTLNDAVAIWSVANTGVFLQDTWRISPRFNLMIGARVDQQNVPTKPLFNAAAAAPRVAGSVAANGAITRDSGGFGLNNTETLDGNRLVQPRVGFNWDLSSNERRSQLRGGFGLFQGAAANVWLSNPFSNTGEAVGTLNCTSYTTCANAGAVFSPNPATQPGLTGTPPAPNLDFLSPDIEQPSVWKANLAFETELPNWPVIGGLTAGVEWLHTRVNKSIYYQHLNLGDPTRVALDGRQMFWTPQTLDPNCWSGSTFLTTGSGVDPVSGVAFNCADGRIRALSNPRYNNVYLARATDLGSGNVLTLTLSRPVQNGFGWSVGFTRTTAKEVSPLTSSTSGSNWGLRNILNPNENVLQNSNYLTKDRITAGLNFTRALVGDYRTIVGVFYEGRRGKPYSWTFLNDANGDGQGGNDLMYIPRGPGSGEVVFRGGAAEEARFWDVVNAHPGLSGAKGGVVGRNDNYAPWVNNIDLRFSQEVPGFSSKHKGQITFDILNFGNLLNNKWGRIDEIGFPSNRSFVNFNGIDSQGRYVYSVGSLEDFVTRQVGGESQWALQVTLRYSF